MNDKNKPRWSNDALDFSGARKIMEQADMTLEKMQELYQLRRQQLVNLQRKAAKHGNTN